MRVRTVILAFLFAINCTFAQKVTVSGIATDSSKGVYSIEIVINDTLSRLMNNPKEGKQKYLKIYQDPDFVVRTDSTGRFSIKARHTDTLYFKSYRHKTQARAVKDLLRQKKIRIELQPEKIQD